MRLHFDYQDDCIFHPEMDDEELLAAMSKGVSAEDQDWSDIKPETEKEKLLAALLFRRSAALQQMIECLEFCAVTAHEQGDNQYAEMMGEILNGDMLVGVIPEIEIPLPDDDGG